MNRHFMSSYTRRPTEFDPSSSAQPAFRRLFSVASLAAFFAVTAHANAFAWTRTVCSSCTYKTITHALKTGDTFAAGDTIIVTTGTYRERVDLINLNDGSAGNPAVIKADGEVIIDGADRFDDPDLWTPTSVGSNVYYAYADTTPLNPPTSQLFINGARYKYVAAIGDYAALAPGEWAREESQSDTIIYVNAGGTNPGNAAALVGSNSRRNGFNVDSTDYVVIDGFTVRHTEEGIDIRGVGTNNSSLNIQGVVVKNCTSHDNWKRGIFLRNCVNCALEDNVTYGNGGHGIYLTIDSACIVARNRSYGNDDPTQPLILGSVAGIKLENTSASRDVRNTTLDYNIVYDNEDTGLDLKGAAMVLVRRNVSYGNGDHGYDNNDTDGTTFLNDVAVGNDHDGISVENNAHNVRVQNCILAYNAVDGTTLTADESLAELWVGDTTQVVTDHNVFTALSPHGNVFNDEGRKRHLVQWGSSAHDTLPEHQSGSEVDGHSLTADPKFVGATDFRLRTTSPGVDGADTTGAGWLATDVLGFKRYDCRSVANTGSPSGTYGDVGPYEHDDGAPTIQVENWGCNGLKVKWIARGAGADTLPVPSKYEVFQNDIVVREDTIPQEPGNQEIESFSGLAQYEIYSFRVKTTDANGDTAISNTAYGTPCCNPPCEIERPGGSRAALGRDGAEDYPLWLAGVVPNPSRGSSSVSWSIPKAQAGTTYDLSLYDVAGRRVSRVAGGTAKAGRFTQELSFRFGNGTPLANGVLFLQLKVGKETLTRTLVLTR